MLLIGIFVLDKSDLNAKIVALIRVNDNKSYEIVDKINNGDKCIVVLDKTIFYAEKGGQQSDIGEMKIKKNSNIKIDYVEQLQGYVFHHGTFASSQPSDLKVKEEVICNIDGQKRYSSTMNHTGVHILNHSIRSFYDDENSIIQVNSSAKDYNLKLEFLLNRKRLDKPNKNDIKSIETICKTLIDKALPIYEFEADLDTIETKSNVHPIRKLRDVLYPRNVRVVSIGDTIDHLLDDSKPLNKDFSSELCCGTHATNTRQLENFKIIDFTLSSDAYYEIEACTSQKANEIEGNERKVDDLYNEIIQIDQQTNSGLHEISKKSIEIEQLTQQLQLSYFYRLKLKENLEKYRPSKAKLQKVLLKYLDDQIKVSEDRVKQFIAFDSVLGVEQIVSSLFQIKDSPSVLIIYNEFRKTIIIKLDEKIAENKQTELFKLIESKFNKSNVKFDSKNHNKNIKILKLNEPITKNNLNSICKTIEINL